MPVAGVCCVSLCCADGPLSFKRAEEKTSSLCPLLMLLCAAALPAALFSFSRPATHAAVLALDTHRCEPDARGPRGLCMAHGRPCKRPRLRCESDCEPRGAARQRPVASASSLDAPMASCLGSCLQWWGGEGITGVKGREQMRAVQFNGVPGPKTARDSDTERQRMGAT